MKNLKQTTLQRNGCEHLCTHPESVIDIFSFSLNSKPQLKISHLFEGGKNLFEDLLFEKMSGQNSFLPQAVDMVRQAIEADNNKEYEKAHTLYTNSLERFILAIKCTFFFLDVVLSRTTHVPKKHR